MLYCRQRIEASESGCLTGEAPADRILSMQQRNASLFYNSIKLLAIDALQRRLTN